LLTRFFEKGRFAEAARNCYEEEGKIIIRLCHDGRTEGYGTSVLLTGKILGDTGGEAEISFGLFGIKEKRGMLMKAYTGYSPQLSATHSDSRQSPHPAEQLAQYLGPMFAQFAELETEGILLCGEHVPIHFVFCLDGKAHQQTIGMTHPPNYRFARA
jgi:hypothetical protein